MPKLPTAERGAPIVAGLAGLAWFWLELAPQRYGFEDTDNPATGLAFVAAHPEAWQQAGVALAVMALALVVTVLAMRDRMSGLEPLAAEHATPIAPRAVTVVGLVAAAALLGMAGVRLSGGPMLYVRGLDQAWGEMAYTVTQFVGVQLLAVGGLALLALWIVGIAWIGGRGGAVPRGVAILALLPGVRLLAIPGLAGAPDWLWFVMLAALPAAFLWLVLLGVWRPSPRATRIPVTSPASL